MRMEVVIAGVGGQGALLASEVLSRYALDQGFHVMGNETIGAAQRGGSVVAHVRISEDAIFSPLVPLGRADLLLGLEPIEELRHWKRLKHDGKYILNLDPVPTMMCNMGLDRYPEEDEIRACLKTTSQQGFVLHATQEARSVGNSLLMNVIVLGALSSMEPFFEVGGIQGFG